MRLSNSFNGELGATGTKAPLGASISSVSAKASKEESHLVYQKC